ncbi:MAG TPA: hypothetical protein DCM73_16515 [Clostridiales bacterium]|nr:hypothetical protein [Clostridiales bacterium]
MTKKIKSIICLMMVILIVLSGCAPASQNTDSTKSNAETTAKIKAGTYTAEEQGYGGAVKVTLTVDETGKITDGEVNATTETEKIGQAAAPTVLDSIISSNSCNVDAVTGTTLTSKALYLKETLWKN